MCATWEIMPRESWSEHAGGEARPMSSFCAERPSRSPPSKAHAPVSPPGSAAGPAGMPRDVVTLLNRGINAALRLPDVQEKAHLFGLDARGSTPEEMAERMKTTSPNGRR